MPPQFTRLVERYRDCSQGAVVFRAPSWATALKDVPGAPLALLTSDDLTEPVPGSATGDRTVTRATVREACRVMDLDDREAVLAAFVLTMAWGAGKTGSRALRNTRAAVLDPRAHEVLAETARLLRAGESPDDGSLAASYRYFRLRGVRRSFFTKWFTFAGNVDGRPWQPLILDARVHATLNNTMGVDTRTMAGDRRRALRYQAYVVALHSWAEDLRTQGVEDADAQRLEWMMFRHNGADL